MSEVRITEGIQDAMDEIINEYSNVPLEERFDDLMQQLIAFSYVMIERHRNTGVPPRPHEREWQEETMKQLKIIDSVFKIAKKYGRVSTKANINFDGQTIQKIKDMKIKSSIGEIVQKLPVYNDSNDSDSINTAEESLQGQV